MSRQRPIPTPDPAALHTAVRTYYAERLEGGACCSPQPVSVALGTAADSPPTSAQAFVIDVVAG